MIPEEFSTLSLARRCIQQTNRSLFLTGRAGTGKTTFLKAIADQTHKNVMIVAPTGVAAINAGGATIHSVFQLPFGMFLPQHRLPERLHLSVAVNTPQSLIHHMQMGERKRQLLRELELLIIDEVSMLRADLLDAVDHVLRYIRRRRVPFGGVQVLFIGDLLQLPPVVKPGEWNLLKEHYNSIYFFDAKVLQEVRPLYIELDKVFRQTDARFLDLLNNLRENKLTESDVQWLNSYCRPGFVPKPEDLYITLTSHNYKADAMNKEALQRIGSPSHFYTAKFKGDFPENACPVPTTLELRVGAQVMFVKNDPSGQQRFFNGKIGTVTELEEDHVVVECDGEPLVVEPYIWKNIRYVLNEHTHVIEESELGTFTQYPLKLAWAITVHKSQGLTFDKAILDIGDAFASGQAYVALSRLRSIDGLVLLSPLSETGIAADEEVISYARKNQLPLHEMNEYILKDRVDYLENSIIQAFGFDELHHKFRFHFDSYSKDELRSAKQKYKQWAAGLVMELEPLRDTSAKFQKTLKGMFAEKQSLDIEAVLERTKSAITYFSPLLEVLIAKIRAQQDIIRLESGVRKYQTELYSLESTARHTIKKISRTEKFIEAFRDNTELNKATLGIGEIDADQLRDKTLHKKSRRQKVAGEKTPKMPTKEITFQLYQKGHSVQEIAEQRGMVSGTIEGHLADCVVAGLLPVEKFIDPVKIEAILEVARKYDTERSGEIKQFLGDEFSYGDIKMALAYKKFMESTGATTEQK